MIDKKKLSQAVRDLDNRADSGEQFPEVVASFHLSQPDLLHVAEQRALRALMVMKGMLPPFPMGLKLTPQEQKLLASMTSVWIDGILTGLSLTRGGRD